MVNEQKSRFTLIPILVCWERVAPEEAKKEIEEIYKALMAFRQYRPDGVGLEYILDSVFLIHPTPIEKLNPKIDYSTARKLLTMGNNYVHDEEWQNFGGYKLGMFPLAPPLETLTGYKWEKPLDHQRLRRLLRIYLLETGALDHCWQCNRSNIGVNHGRQGDEYFCYDCRYEWGIRICNHCGKRIIKVIPMKR
ncbi:MAG: hypothetical protein AB1523_01125 [Bacillota bacterium]